MTANVHLQFKCNLIIKSFWSRCTLIRKLYM